MKHIKTSIRFIGLWMALPFAVFAIGFILAIGVLLEMWNWCERIGETETEKQERLKREWRDML